MTNLAASFKDVRGLIIDLTPKYIQPGIDAITLITSKRGAIRGNHYHKETHQWTYIVKGRTRVVHLIGEQFIDATYEAGELIYHAPGTSHAFEAVEDTEWLVFTKGPRAGEDYEKDTFRLEIPLI